MLLFAPINVLIGLIAGFSGISAVQAVKGDSGCGHFLCLNATLDGHMVNYEVTLREQPVGWVGIGWGRKMKGSHMVVMWPNEDGSTTLSHRYATGHVEPQEEIRPPRIARLLEPRVTSWHLVNSTRFAFRILANKTLLESDDPLERLIWAYGKTRPSKRPDSRVGQHFVAGFLKLDLTKTIPDDQTPWLLSSQDDQGDSQIEDVPTRPSVDEGEVSEPEEPTHDHPVDHSDHDINSMPYDSREKTIITHGLFASFGFLVLLPLGSLIARWSRTLTPAWFKAHRMVNMYIALPVITLGWLLGPIAVHQQGAAHLYGAHQRCGVLLLILYYLQVLLGRYIHNKRNKVMKVTHKGKPRAHPPMNIVHVVFGLSVMGLAFFQVRSGLNEWSVATGRTTAKWSINLWNIWVVIIPGAYLVGLSFLSRQFYQEEHGIAHNPEQYIALSDGSASPELVFAASEDGGHVIYEEGGRRMNHSAVSLHAHPGLESAIPLLNSHEK